jgi:hypothetical protein
VRAIVASDAVSARSVVLAQFGDTPYCVRIQEQLDIALTGEDPEYLGLVMPQSGGHGVLGALLYGPIAGASGNVKLHSLVGADVDVLVLLLDALLAESTERTKRMIVCETAEDLPYSAASCALTARAFTRAGRVADYFQDGIALDVLVWRSQASVSPADSTCSPEPR